MKIAEISIKRPSLILVLFIGLTLGGLLSYLQMGYELVPKFEVNVISIQTLYPGASPSEVENSVTKKIEDAISTLENVKSIESKSLESVSVVIVRLNDDADVDFLLNDAQRKINAIVNDLPEDAKVPTLAKFSFDDIPIMNLSVTSPKLSEKELYDLLDKKIQPAFARLDGVAKIGMIGGEVREIQVSINPEKAKGYGLTIIQIQQLIAASNMDFPTGSIKSRDNQMTIRLAGKFLSIDEMRNMILTTPAGVNIRLSDVAEVQDGIKDIEKLARLNGDNTILLQVYKQSDANAVTVSEEVKNKILQVEKDFKINGISIDIASNSTDYTLRAANNVSHDLLLAVILVGAIMLFFLHSIRNAIITMIAIPLSLISTFIVLNLLGYTLNLMTLLGLSLVVGILVDDAIVVIENIHRHMEMGKNRVRASYDGVKEIGFTVSSITLVIVVVFFPISVSTGMVSNILRQFTVTVMVSTLFSLLISFTLVPWLYSRFGRLDVIRPETFVGRLIHRFETILKRISSGIGNLLEWSLAKRSHKVITLFVAFLLFISSFVLIGKGYIGSDFFPDNDKGEFLLQLELKKDATIEQTNQAALFTESLLLERPEITKIITTVGQSSDGMISTTGTKNKAEIHIFLQKDYYKTEATKVYSTKLIQNIEDKLIGVKLKSVNLGLMGAEQAPIKLTVVGSTQADAEEFASQAAELLRKIPGTTGIKLTSEGGNPEIDVKVDRDKMATLGLNVATVGMAMQTAFAGNTSTKFRSGDREYDINIRYDASGRASINDVKNLEFINPYGQVIKLEQFATVTYGTGPSLLERRDKSPSVSVEAQVVGMPTGTVASEWEKQFTKLDKKPGVDYVWGGNMENQKDGFGSLAIALVASIVLVYLVMVALYDNFATPLVVLFSIPLSFIGALLFLAIFNQTLNIFTILGIIMLIGLVAKNAILLVDFANHSKANGATTHDALMAANHTRFRPIIMTTIAMAVGMLPIAIAQGDGADINRGLAMVIIGGLLSSLFLTLVVVPVVYSIFDTIGMKLRGGKEKTNYSQMLHADRDNSKK
ncbi:MAG: efflux RND transporter permease subunit [Bacteroidetes bacterium]|nr:efflux RND transporter permease subunit [Bacteroidota bacterium]